MIPQGTPLCISLRDLWCAVVGCRRPVGNRAMMFIHVCMRCGRTSFLMAKVSKGAKAEKTVTR